MYTFLFVSFTWIEMRRGEKRKKETKLILCKRIPISQPQDGQYISNCGGGASSWGPLGSSDALKMENPWIETQCCHTQTYMFTFWGLSWFLCKMGATTFTSLASGEEWLKQWCKNHLQGQLLFLLGTLLQDFEGWWGKVRGEFILSWGTWALLRLEEHGDHYFP